MKKDVQAIFTNVFVVMFFALISCLLWGSAFPCVKLGYQVFNISSSDTYGKLLFAGYRFFISSIMIGVFCKIIGYSLRIRKKDIWKVTLLGFIQTLLQYIFFYIGLSNTSGTKGAILAATNTFFSVIIAHFFYTEDKMKPRRMIGLILGFIGVVIVNIKGGGIGGGFRFLGEGFVILSSLSGAVASVYTKKLARGISPFALSGYQLFTGSLMLMFIGFTGRREVLSFNPKGGILLLYMAFISAAAFSIWSLLLKYNSVGKVCIYQFSIPLFGVILSYIFLHERLMGYNVIVAGILVSLGIIFINKE